MKKFKDTTQAEWEINLLIGEVERVRIDSKGDGDFNLYEPQENDLGKRLDDDPILFWKLLWHLVKPEAALHDPTAEELARRTKLKQTIEEPGITAEEFGRRMAGDCLIAAQDAFLDEWHDFFHLLQRPDKAAALASINLIRKQTFAKVKAKIEADETLKALPARTGAKIDQLLETQFSDMRASFESILGDSPTANSGSDIKESADTTEP